MTGQPQNTPLLAAHQSASARIVDFAGFRMPLQYTGIIDEHQAVRTACGLFDVSHMGEVEFTGPGALAAVDRLMTNAVCKLSDGQILYTPICYPDGGIVDDCLVYRHSADKVLVVVNASNVDKDYAWFAEQTGKACTVTNRSAEWALVALQGPRAAALWSRLAGQQVAELPSFHFAASTAAGIACVSSRTGYTGEDGYEIFCRPDDAPALWGAIVEAGGAFGLKLCGLGARDTLRLEARLMLYGNDIDQTTSPLEAGLGWTVKLKGRTFIGSDVLSRQKAEGLSRRLVCLEMRGRGIARHGHPVCRAQSDGLPQDPVGHVTSGTMSPTLGRAIALAYVPTALAELGTRLHVDVRGKAVEAEVVRGPFYQRPNP
ncbi:MAG: glycine cleavage system aminomethyltransferase GcvT [Deltaproteobacteria bacterium]|nr:glycine cleavage system aminomethyltransferase GcvT [Deltaproteobacteria bacterium]